MSTKYMYALLSALILSIAVPVLADESGLGCEGPFGPVFGTPDPGLYATDLISDGGDKIGIVEVYNTSVDVNFILKPNSDIDLTNMQLWVGPKLDGEYGVVTKKDGKPWYGKFEWVEKLKLDFGEEYTFTLNLIDDLDFNWKGQSHQMGILLHGDFVDSLDNEDGFLAMGQCEFPPYTKVTYSRVRFDHPDRGHFIDSAVVGIGFHGPTQKGVTQAGGPD